MAPIAASLTIDFISNFVGQHRVCFRIPPAILYDCTTTVICTGGGAACQAIISITVDNESCDPVTYEGYVQAACQDVNSLIDRIPFSITFYPNPTCNSYRVTCDSVGVDSINVNEPGFGYDPLTPPTVAITGGGGAGATATATVGNTVTITNPGAGYAPDAVYINVPVINVVGAGTGALATVTVAGGVITAVTITNNGDSCYIPGNTFTFNDANLGGGGGAGFAGAFGIDYGVVTVITVTAPGSGYTSYPTVTVDPNICPAGDPSLAAAVLADCTAQTLGTTCSGDPSPVITMCFGQSAIECMMDLPTIQPGYTFVPEGCCYDCVNVDFTTSALDPLTNVTYTDCTTKLATTVAVPAGGAGTAGPFCAVNNSWFWNPCPSGIVVNVGSCCGTCP